MAIEYNVTWKEFNGEDYDNVYPKTKDSNISITGTSASNLGLGSNSTVKDVLDSLPRIIIHNSTENLPTVVNGAILIAYDA
jgi:hypothetical protein